MRIELLKVVANTQIARWDLTIKNTKHEIVTCYIFWSDCAPDFPVIDGEDYIDDPQTTSKVMEYINKLIDHYDV